MNDMKQIIREIADKYQIKEVLLLFSVHFLTYRSCPYYTCPYYYVIYMYICHFSSNFKYNRRIIYVSLYK